MKANEKTSVFILLIIVALIAILVICIIATLSNRATVHVRDVDDVLINPGKGFVDYTEMFYKEGYDHIFGIGYMRFDWSYIEPQKDDYKWERIDRYIDEYAKLGKQFAFGVMCVNIHSQESYVTPQWVFDDGAKYVMTTSTELGRPIEQYIPDWKDEVFLRNLNDFVKALGKRYNGNKNVAFIDIRSYGNWGEQHLFHIIQDDENYEYVIANRLKPEELRDLYIKPYMEAFPDTLLVNPWGEAIYNDVYKWAIDNGVTVRRDGVIGVSDGSECALAEDKLPTIFEYCYDYTAMLDMGLWDTTKLLEYVNIGKPSYMRLPQQMYDENKEFCDYLANYMGYHFRIKRIDFDRRVKLGNTTNVTIQFKNDGVAPIFAETYAYVALLDENNNIVAKFKMDADARKWMPNTTTTESIDITIEGIDEGRYKLAFGLFQKETDENPTYLFGSRGKTENNWYVFGNIRISK